MTFYTYEVAKLIHQHTNQKLPPCFTYTFTNISDIHSQNTRSKSKNNFYLHKFSTTHAAKNTTQNEVLRIRVKKFRQSLPEKCSKSTKIAIAACNISKIFWGSIPSDPPKAFSVFQSASISSAEKITLEKNVEITVAPLKIFLYVTTLPLEQ